MKPVKRSKLRLWAGKRYFMYRRYLEWMMSRKTFAKQSEQSPLEYLIFTHKTPLYRQLKDVDVWYHRNKIVNLQIAVQQLDGLLIRPGETMSYWRTIGRPTRRKGYVDGMVLFYGGFKAGLGGGLCQLSNLIYWMTLHSSLEVTERHRHSYDVFPDANRTQPFGSGATCAYNYLDLQIFNPTNEVYQLRLKVTDQELVGEWRSSGSQLYHYEVYEKDHRFTQEVWGGYARHNIIGRRAFALDGDLVADEVITENHALMMYSPLLTEASSPVIVEHI